jgi:hypothetical protein
MQMKACQKNWLGWQKELQILFTQWNAKLHSPIQKFLNENAFAQI